MKLSQLKTSQAGIITHVTGQGSFRKRITEMGFVKGQRVVVVKNAPLRDPIEYSIMGYEVSLRRKEAQMIEVELDNNIKQELRFSPEPLSPHVDFNEDIPAANTEQHSKLNRVIKVALVGNPNSGKTSLFNYISGLNEHTGNYSGVTVDSKEASVEFDGYTIRITDLPGTYSLSEFSPEERFVREYISRQKPDIVINVVDASNLERNLYLTTQLIDMQARVIIALNMYDELLASGDRFDHRTMGRLLGMPLIPTISKRGRGVPHLLRQITESYASISSAPEQQTKKINYPAEIEGLIDRVAKKMSSQNRTSYCNRYVAIKLIEGDEDMRRLALPDETLLQTIEVTVRKAEQLYGDDIDTLMADARYGFISGALKETYTQTKTTRHNRSREIDNFLTHKYLGFPIFLLMLWFVFFTTFTLGAYPMEWIGMGVAYLQDLVSGVMPEGALKDLVVNGVMDGVGSVIVFLPNILILFFFISIMEDTGYMARTAFITDKLMHKIGLHGKSFIPLVMGFGCNVPAIMATRTIEHRSNRLQTMLITPFMSCSARLPVYLLVVGAFFPDNAANVLFIIYIGGIVLAIISSLLFKKLFFKSQDVHFVMELPPYRIPTMRSTIKHMWNKGSQYLQKMGGVILVAVVIIWALGYYPRDSNEEIATYNTEVSDMMASDIPDRDSLLRNLVISHGAQHENNSYLGQIGRFVEPVIRPLGFDWKMGIGLLSGIAAKEVIVSSMSVLYQTKFEDPELLDGQLGSRLREERYTDGDRFAEPVWNQAVAVSFLTFVLIYFPCVAAIGAIRKESGALKWALLTVFYTTAMAWLVSFATYRIALLFV